MGGMVAEQCDPHSVQTVVAARVARATCLSGAISSLGQELSAAPVPVALTAVDEIVQCWSAARAATVVPVASERDQMFCVVTDSSNQIPKISHAGRCSRVGQTNG